MYLLFLDESGTHAGSHSVALGGVALHEDDAGRLQEQLDQLVIRHLQRVPPNLEEFELHAGEMRNAKKPKVDSPQRASIWASFRVHFAFRCCPMLTKQSVIFRPTPLTWSLYYSGWFSTQVSAGPIHRWSGNDSPTK